MRNKIKLIILTLIISVGLNLNSNAISAKTKASAKVNVKTQSVSKKHSHLTSSLDIVANPKKYLNKRVTIRAQFDKFSTLGLDYKPAYKSSEKYITFLIKRDDVINHVVPLSELKNFLDRKIAEKYVDLEPGDIIEYSGVVFSDALSDAWISVDEFKVLSQKSKKDKK